jgi:hypothetical protein
MYSISYVGYYSIDVPVWFIYHLGDGQSSHYRLEYHSRTLQREKKTVTINKVLAY